MTSNARLHDDLLASPAARQWKLIGTSKRAGITAPLFSLHSTNSAGIGEIIDLKLLIDWCVSVNLSIVQLLPLNDVGFNFRPYDALSSFALDPMYLSLDDLIGVDRATFQKELDQLKSEASMNSDLIDYSIKGKKLELLWKIYIKYYDPNHQGYQGFLERERFWLDDYGVFKVIRYLHQEKHWLDWPLDHQRKDAEALAQIREEHSQAVSFQFWMQWQLAEQMHAIKRYADSKSVLLMGDLPFLVSRESADVWSHPEYFKLSYSSGAPPDDFLVEGQRWGMPPYEWSTIERDNYSYLREKLRTASNYYHTFRLDHAIGVFRLWTINMSEPPETAGMNGQYDPVDENGWARHGARILGKILEASPMLPLAEDLGTVPECSPEVLRQMGIPGMDIPRWQRSGDVITPSNLYRELASVSLTTHDMAPVAHWWNGLSVREKKLYADYLEIKPDAPIEELAFRAMESAFSSPSLFAIHLIHDYLSLDQKFKPNQLHSINIPGSMDPNNWRWRMPNEVRRDDGVGHKSYNPRNDS